MSKIIDSFIIIEVSKITDNRDKTFPNLQIKEPKISVQITHDIHHQNFNPGMGHNNGGDIEKLQISSQ